MRIVEATTAGLLAWAASGAAPAAVMTLQPGRDATLYATADGSVANGAGAHIFIGRNSQGQTRRSLVWFDIAGALPAGVTITDATLTLHVSSGDSALLTATMHRVLTDWNEGPSDPPSSEGQGAASQPGDATWLHTFYDGAFWATPGGDFIAGPSASTLVGGVGDYTFTGAGLVDDLQAWLDGSLDNFGWILRGDETFDGSARRFDSRQNATESVRPVLTITYVVPTPGAGACLLIAGSLGALRRRRVVPVSHN